MSHWRPLSSGSSILDLFFGAALLLATPPSSVAGGAIESGGDSPREIRGTPVTAVRTAVVNVGELARLPMSLAPVIGQAEVAPPFRAQVEEPGGHGVVSQPVDPIGINGPAKTAVPSPSPDLTYEAQADIPAGGFSYIPPDTWGAVGLTKVMSVHNNNVRILDKTTGAQLSIVTLNAFWSGTGATGVFDPRVVYDPYNSRWIVSATSNASSAASSILVGVSQTSDPSGTFNLFRVDGDAADTMFVDFPTLGFNKNWVAIGVNMFSISSNQFRSTRVLSVNYPNMLTGSFSATLFTGIPDFTVVPCVTYSSTENTLYMPNHNGSAARNYRLNTITGTPAAPVYTQGSLIAHAVLPAWTQPSGDALPQSGGNLINVGDARIINAVFRGGNIFYAQTVGIPGGGLTHTGAQWVKLNTSGAFVDGGRVEDPTATVSNGGKWYAYPSIAVNVMGDLLIGFSQFSSAQFAGAGYVFRDRADAAGTTRDPLVYKAGLGNYWKTFGAGRNRWGDYSFTQVDPSDDFTLWTIQEYAATPVGSGDGSGRWGTWWARVPPVTPLPVQLASFKGVMINGTSVRLTWSTLSELNNFGFEVQKSASSGGEYNSIPGSFVPGQGTTNVPQSYSFTDANPGSETLYYRLKQYDLDGSIHYSEAIMVDRTTGIAEEQLPKMFSLEQNYPNPFNPSTSIRYGIPRDAEVTLEVFNPLGQKVAQLVNGRQTAGFYDVTFNASGLSSGAYFYIIKAGEYRASKKIMLLK